MAEGGGPIDPAGAKVLVVATDAQGVELTARLLAREGFEVDRTDDLDDAVGRLYSSKPPIACVVVDVDGAASGGISLLEAIRGSDSSKVSGTRVVICSNVESNRLPAWKAGADGFLARPFHADDLLEAVRDALGRTDGERLSFRQVQAGITGGA